MLRAIALTLCVAMLAACSGLTSQSSIPAPVAAKKDPREKAHVVLRIKVPKHRVRRGRHSQFVSPATQSIRVVITNTNPATNVDQVVNLTPTSTGCTSTLATTQCTLTIALSPGNNFDATVTSYDQTGAAGNRLSTAQNVSFNVVAGTGNAIALTLSGIPARVAVLPGSLASTVALQGGIDLLGTGQHRLIAEALDADDNVIVGPGSPAFTVSQPLGKLGLGLTQPTTSAPNAFYVQPPGAFSANTATLSVQASFNGQPTDGCAQSGAVCSTSVVVAMDQLMAVANASSVEVVDLTTGIVAGTASTGIAQVDAIAFDRSGNLYVSNCGVGCGNAGSDSVLVYSPPYTGTPVVISSSVAHPEGVALDGSGNLYVANDVILGTGSGTDDVTEYAPPFSAASTPVKTITNSIGQPGPVAIDSNNDLFVANASTNAGAGSVSAYAANYAGGAPTYGPITTGINGPTALALDASANLYVSSPSDNWVTKYFGFNAVGVGAIPYTCTNNCGNALPNNPVTVTACNTCATFTPGAIVTVPNGGNGTSGYQFFVASSGTPQQVLLYTNATTPAVSTPITSNITNPAALAIDQSDDLFVANSGNSVTEYLNNTYAFSGAIVSAFSSPVALAILP